MTLRIALYEPDIPQNTGTVLRLCACLGVDAHLIGPAGFPTSDRAFRRAGMDYLDAVALTRHDSWRDFDGWRRREGHRLVLFTTAASMPYLDYRFEAGDILLFGREFGGGAATGSCHRRRAAFDPDASGPAFAQRRDRRRHSRRRSAKADWRNALSLRHFGPAAFDHVTLPRLDMVISAVIAMN